MLGAPFGPGHVLSTLMWMSSQDLKGYCNSLSRQGTQVQRGMSPAQGSRAGVYFYLIISVFAWVHMYVCMCLGVCVVGCICGGSTCIGVHSHGGQRTIP